MQRVNLYVVDSNNHRIQKFMYDPTAQTYATQGITIAGSNSPGSASNQLNHPFGVFVNAAGAVYVTDSDNNRVQKFAYDFSTQTYATTGQTVAGDTSPGSGPSQLNHPKGIYQDAAGNLFVADAGNHRVQKFALGSLEGTTVAGGNGPGAADNQLSNPVGIYQDAAGNILVADAGNHRVQKFSIITRQIGFAIISVSTVSCVLTNPPGEYQVTFTPEYQDTDGSSITFRAINESLPTTQVDPTRCGCILTIRSLPSKPGRPAGRWRSTASRGWQPVRAGFLPTVRQRPRVFPIKSFRRNSPTDSTSTNISPIPMASNSLIASRSCPLV